MISRPDKKLALSEAFFRQTAARLRGHDSLKLSRRGSRFYVGSCQNYGPFLDTLDIRCRIIIGTQKGTLILTTTHVVAVVCFGCRFGFSLATFEFNCIGFAFFLCAQHH